MMRVQVRKIRDGLHPSEVVVSVDTVDGPEFLTVDRRSVASDSVEIGYPVNERDDQFLVELPRETMTGSWRVWVRKNLMVPSSREHVVA